MKVKICNICGYIEIIDEKTPIKDNCPRCDGNSLLFDKSDNNELIDWEYELITNNKIS